MALFGDPKFIKDLNKSSEASVELTSRLEKNNRMIKENTELLNEYEKSIEETTSAMSEAQKAGNFAEYFDLKKVRDEMQSDVGELESSRAAAREENLELEPEVKQNLDSIREGIFKISDGEMKRRMKHEEEIKLMEKNLTLLEQSNEGGAMDVEISKAREGIQLKKDKEQKRREKQQTSVFKKGFSGLMSGIGKLAAGMKGKAAFALKTGLFIAAFFAISKFLQSDMFKKVIKFINEEFLPVMREVFDFIMQPGGVFDNLKKAFLGVGEFMKGLFDFVVGLFKGDSNLIKDGIDSMIDGLFEIVGGLFESILGLFGFSPEQIAPVSEFFGNFLGEIVGYIKFLLGGIIDAIAYLFSGDIIDDVTRLVSDTVSNIGNFFTDMIDSAVLFLKAFGAGVIAGIKALAPFGESPEDAFAKAFSLTMAKGEEPDINQMQEGFRANKIADAGFDLTPLDKSEKPQINQNIVNNNVVQQGDKVQANYSQRYVKDQESSFANAM